ncbi:MAG TPA: lmo0937 family membrane protein [Kofleriaceae bacterium]|jgi:hypothetical protein|nr:lmo0937 family membrane protein [Kofleriaceae bacterium]
MLATIALVLLVIWLAGVITAHVFGGLIHILLGLAVLGLIFHLVRSLDGGSRNVKPPF